MSLRKNFFMSVRTSLFNGKLNGGQVVGMEAMLDYWEANLENCPISWLAYTFATAFHETARTFGPIKEIGGSTQRYAPYYGRGLVQLTWKKNYEKMGNLLNKDLVNHPDEALKLDVAVPIIFIGMKDGLFTGKGYADYLLATKKDYINARRIINGTDRAKLIAGYADKFEAALLS